MCQTERRRSLLLKRWRVEGNELAVLVVVITIGIYACAVRPPMAAGPLPPALSKEALAYEVPKDAASAGDPARREEPMGALTLRQALSLALMRSPELAAFSWEVRAREAHALQEGLFPNPEISVEVENFGGSGGLRRFEGAETTTLLGQLIELGGKRRKRAKVAALERDLAGWDYETRRVDVLTDVTKAFVAVLGAQEQVEVAEELVSVAQRADEAVAARVRAGATPTVERSRAQVALASSRVERDRLRRELVIARYRLAAFWGGREATFSRVDGDFEQVAALPARAQLLNRIENTPALARWGTELEQRKAAVVLEQARRIPDVAVGGGLRRFSDTGSNALVFELSVPFPVFNWNQGEVAEARYRQAKADYEHSAAVVRARAALGAAYETLAAAFDGVVALRNDVLPLAEAAFTRADSAYRRGRFRYLEVLDAQRTLFELRSQYVATLVAYHAAKADVERLIGEPLENIHAPGRKQ